MCLLQDCFNVAKNKEVLLFLAQQGPIWHEKKSITKTCVSMHLLFVFF